MRVVDMIGVKVGKLTVVSRATTPNGSAKWNCKCACGKATVVDGRNLRRGTTQSCGCLAQEKAADIGRIYGGRTLPKHGHASGASPETPTYTTWASMKARCSNPKNGAYKNYGAKGITYCERWEEFTNFLKDMGPRPEGTTLDRVDGNKGYSPENCRWATHKEQAENRKSSVWIDYLGERLLLSDFAKKLGMRIDTVWHRLNKQGMTPEEVATTPIDENKSRAGQSK